MNALILLTGLTLLQGGSARDTTVTLQRGDRVEVRDLRGEVTVDTWDRATLEISGASGGARAVSVSRTGNRVLVEAAGRRSRSTDIRLTLRVPSWVALDLQGRELDVTVRGVGGAVSVQNVSGDIRIAGTRGDLDLSSVESQIDVRDAHGSVRAQSQGGDVRLTRVVGDVDAGSGDGDVRMDGVQSSSVRAQTLDGDVYFAGPMAKGGTYTFSVHDGDVTLVIPRSTGARVKVATFDGEFSSEFPVTLQHYTGAGRFEFTLGGGGAEASIEVFDGEIRVQQSPAGGRGPRVP